MKLKQIPGYQYYCSEDGRIFNASGKELRQAKNTKGYYIVTLYSDKKRRTTTVHRLVAKTFIDNPYNFPQVNHKDENKENNNVSNLEWCSNIYNARYGTRLIRSVKGHEKPVVSIDAFGHERKFSSIVEAANELKIDRSYITKVAKGKRPSANGYLFRYEN